MKAEFLKIAGVKSDKAFYAKYPTEQAFFKAHPEAKGKIKKAKIGVYVGGDTLSNPGMIDFSKINNANDMMITGMTDAMRMEQAERAASSSQKSSSGSSGMDIGGIMKMFGGEGGEGGGDMGGMMSALGGAAKYGKRIPIAQAGTDLMANYFNQQQVPNINNSIQSQTQSPGVNAGMFNGPQVDNSVSTINASQLANNQSGYAYPGGPNTKESDATKTIKGLDAMGGPMVGIAEGLDALEAEKEQKRSAIQQRQLSELTLKASTTRPEQRERKYVRPEDMVNTGEAFFPVYGVGTNVLARNGARLEDGGMVGGNPTEIQNTYGDGNSIYDDLGYTPLIDENQQKSFRQGGYIPQAQNGFQNWQNSMSGGGSGFSGAGASGGTPWGAIGSQATATGQSAMGGQNAGGKIGGTVGKSIGSIWGPVGGAIGEFAGGMIGNVLDKNPKTIKKEQEKTQRNIQNMAMNQMAPSIQAGYASHVRNGGNISNYEDGGYMNPEYNPQVITMFGDVDEQDFADFAHKDEFRAGGHLKAYREPSERAMQTYENGGGVKSYGLGGELQTHWGGGAETMSYNPYLPGSGETVMFRGKSHEEYSPNGETGIGVTYGGNPVEVERGEPMVELQEGGTIDPQTGEPQKSGVVFGNLKIPDQYIDLLGDKNAKGKKFKNYIANLSKTEEKQNKMIEKSTNELNALDVNSSFDRLKLSSLQANIKGGNLKLKEIADKKIKAADLQNAINDTAEEYGLVADDLARGKVKQDKNAMKEYAKFGGKFTKAQDGKKAQFNSEKEALAAGYIKDANGFYRIIPPEKLEPIETKVAEAQKEIPLQHKDASGLYGGASAKLAQTQRNNPWFDWAGFNPTVKADVERFQKAFNERARSIGSSANLKVDGKFGDQTASALIDEKRMTQPSIGRREEAEILEADTKPVPYKRSGLIDFGNQLLDYIRPTDQEPFDYGQTMGEQYALATNQLEPVQAQLYKPEIGVPYDISYQDVLNENQADFNAQTRKTGYNPAAQSNLNAQKYMANQRVLGEQFRANQAMKDKVYGDNRNILNQAKLTNLEILDKQYERQAQAMSNTKATTQAVLNSISDKLAKHKLENRTLGVYENLYKYRFDDKGRAINMNGIFQPNIPTVASKEGTQRQVPVYKKDGTIDHYQLEEYDPNDTTDTTKPGSTATPGIVAKSGKSITKKNNKNSSIVKAIKNL